MKTCKYDETLECFKREAALLEGEDINVQVEHESKDGQTVLTGEKNQNIRRVPRFLLAISLYQFLLHLYTVIRGNYALITTFIQDTNR